MDTDFSVPVDGREHRLAIDTPATSLDLTSTTTVSNAVHHATGDAVLAGLESRV